MTDTPTPTNAANQPPYPLRRVLILIAALVAVTVAYGQMAWSIGQTPAEFSADGDSTLRVAGFAFAIWGVIYAWLMVYAVYQAIPSTTENPTIRALGWPSLLAFAGIGLWIVASAADWEWGSVGIIVVSLLSLLIPLVARAPLLRAAPLKQRALVVWPLSLLAGWLTVASVVNLITVLTGQGLLPDVMGPKAWAAAAIVLTMAASLALTWRIDQWPYPLPIAWGLFGAFVAERSENILVAFVCLVGSVVVLLGGLWLTVARKRTPRGAAVIATAPVAPDMDPAVAPIPEPTVAPDAVSSTAAPEPGADRPVLLGSDDPTSQSPASPEEAPPVPPSDPFRQ